MKAKNLIILGAILAACLLYGEPQAVAQQQSPAGRLADALGGLFRRRRPPKSAADGSAQDAAAIPASGPRIRVCIGNQEPEIVAALSAALYDAGFQVVVGSHQSAAGVIVPEAATPTPQPPSQHTNAPTVGGSSIDLPPLPGQATDGESTSDRSPTVDQDKYPSSAPAVPGLRSNNTSEAPDADFMVTANCAAPRLSSNGIGTGVTNNILSVDCTLTFILRKNGSSVVCRGHGDSSATSLSLLNSARLPKALRYLLGDSGGDTGTDYSADGRSSSGTGGALNSVQKTSRTVAMLAAMRKAITPTVLGSLQSMRLAALEGEIIGQQEGKLVINLGTKDGLAQGMTLEVLHVTNSFVDSKGKEYKTRRHVATIVIESVDEETAIARNSSGPAPDKGDIVRFLPTGTR